MAVWRPSEKQVAIAELLLNPEDRRPKKAKLDAVGLPERTFYRWMKDPRFLNYLNSKLDQYTAGGLVDVWHSLINQAKRGNIQAIKLYFEMKGMYRAEEERLKLAQQKLELEKEKFEFNKEVEKSKNW
ncbi:phBC6A51 family helix-turn-helix protein [Desulforamulus aquiferis]|uniref:PhBC6A51 family helix-turn-helix protein n=1 Tax=Desulforamulus aquiferis TaxID=1397668 RepID=A0AAW7Z9K5_9FIRM|nr:phBC6A51 family helix-turn-helix protein [Desulforamulus aquiferis]MDO7786100.1 phBC6A51 family helix-turn-helix protein [Desulforamulus aquiferis]